jgi:hypothetical protein
VLEVNYLARRITDVIENAFIAFGLAKNIVSIFGKVKDKKKVWANSGFIIQEVVKKLLEIKFEQEQAIFDSLLKSKKLVPAVSAEKDIGYQLPEESEVFPDNYELFKNNLFERSDLCYRTSLAVHDRTASIA